MNVTALQALALLPLVAAGSMLRYAPSSDSATATGVMNANGVTRYGGSAIEVVHSDKFYWSDPGSHQRQEFTGALDLSENVSWGWHHPNGVFTSIPVGAPLIDNDLNIFLGSDDAVRKWNVVGDLLWSYGPRGQLAAAPSLVLPGTRRQSARKFSAEEDAEQEAMLQPDWKKHDPSTPNLGLFQDVKVGDRIKVKNGMGYHADGKEYYKSGDMGSILNLFSQDGQETATIHWSRTNHTSVAAVSTLGKRFVHLKASNTTSSACMLVGSTTSGFVFAVDCGTGEEVWVTQVSTNMISGVKGVVSAKDGIVVVATDRCTDRYCYRYRNQSNPLTPSNSVVRGLDAGSGGQLWTFKPMSPVWNFVPQYNERDGTVLFSDFAGRVYCLDLATGTEKWASDGAMGTFTQASAVLNPGLNMIYGMGAKAYERKACNPFPAPGILPPCNTLPGSAGWVKGYNATSGREVWAIETSEPPNSAAVGLLNSPSYHSRLVLTLGHNCMYNSASWIYSLDPMNGHTRWIREGPTLWTPYCAGDKEGADIRRALSGRASCEPGSWSVPAIDKFGFVYVGNQVGVLQKWGTTNGMGGHHVELVSTLTTGIAFQDNSITLAKGVMAVSTCTSLIVFQTGEDEPRLTENWTFEIPY